VLICCLLNNKLSCSWFTTDSIAKITFMPGSLRVATEIFIILCPVLSIYISYMNDIIYMNDQ
jgi:hypothetical protein